MIRENQGGPEWRKGGGDCQYGLYKGSNHNGSAADMAGGKIPGTHGRKARCSGTFAESLTAE